MGRKRSPKCWDFYLPIREYHQDALKSGWNLQPWMDEHISLHQLEKWQWEFISALPSPVNCSFPPQTLSFLTSFAHRIYQIAGLIILSCPNGAWLTSRMRYREGHLAPSVASLLLKCWTWTRGGGELLTGCQPTASTLEPLLWVHGFGSKNTTLLYKVKRCCLHNYLRVLGSRIEYTILWNLYFVLLMARPGG